jgi:hypothetical protein
MAKTRFFRVAVEGATTDGRVIERDWIEQMAAGYNPATYTARINCEHLHGFSPEAPFNAYGSVVALKAEEVEIQIDGKAEKRLALFAQLDANDQLVEINKKGQKLFTSIEIAPNFAGTGKAGLVGLAVTDNPASLGTEMLQFAAAKPMFDARKQDPANLFSAAEEAAIEIEGASDDQSGWLTKLTGVLDGFASRFAPEEKPKEEPATPPAPANDNDMAAFAKSVGETVTTAIGLYAASNDAAVAAIRTDLAALTTKLESTEQPGFTRKPATGGNGGIVTDC